MARKTASRSSRTTRTAYKARPSTKSYAPKRYAKKKPASKIAGVTVPDGVIHYTTTAGRNNLHIEVMRPAWRTQKLPILFIHGAFDSSWIYRTPMKMLAKSGRRVYAVNLRGYSYSKCYNVAHLDIKDHLADIASVRKDLKLHKVIVAGYSSGGLFAQKHVESCGANGLVLYDPSHSKEISNAIGEKRNPREHVNAVEMFIPDESVLTEMFGRPIRGREYQTLLHHLSTAKCPGKFGKILKFWECL
ncbi:MAG: alpha/beta fold hydrolase [Candidatus Lindowbacteria bacterium]|nr:alpha/beta fold hydrolase [Candidatus Lindowbacteria bacterium]